MAKSTAYWEKTDDYQGLSVDSAYRSLSALLAARLARSVGQDAILSYKDALEQAHKALEFAEKTVKSQYPYPRDFVQAYWLLGEALIKITTISKSPQIKPYEIHFYDEHFQQQIKSVVLKDGDELQVAERCLNEALRRCRKVNLVESEPDILLACARLEWAKLEIEQRGGEKLPDIEETLKDAYQIAERAGYRLALADIYLFCGKVLLEIPEGRLLGLTVPEHLQKAKEYAKDVSTFEDLYQSKDPHFYDGIPEYDMLKRGMTEEERIENGYWVTYKIAEALEKRLDK